MKKSSDKLKVSVSSTKTYLQCGRKYRYQYIDKLPQKPPAEHLHLGKFVHAVLEGFHNALMEDPELDWATQMTSQFKIELARQNKDNTGLEYPLLPESKIKAHQMLVTYLGMLRKDGMPPVVENERGFTIDIGDDVVVRGFIDRIDRDADGTHTINDYKGLAIDTPIPTPSGWSTMGALQVGDKVLGSDGRPTAITVKSQIHNRPCYKLTLSDHSQVVCDNVHLWKIGLRKNGSVGNYDDVIDADELFRRFGEAAGDGNFIISNPAPLALPDIELPINPWLLGAWLGDGHSKTGSVTVGKQDLVATKALLERHWGRVIVTEQKRYGLPIGVYTITCVKRSAEMCGYGHAMAEANIYAGKKHCKICGEISNANKSIPTAKTERWNGSLRGYLADSDLLLNKHIPPAYLRASFEQRLELLRGLMDTDGHWHPQRSRCVFVSSKKSLYDSVVELVRTFGVTVQTFKVTDKLGFVSYRIEFRPVGFNPFSLPRKAAGVESAFPPGHTRPNHAALRRTITSIEKVDSVPTQCIAVDAPDQLYLCGTGFVVTHNTGKSKYLDEFQLLIYGKALLETEPNLEFFKGDYIMLGENCKHLPYTFSRTDIDRTVLKIKKIAEDIRADQTWEPKPSFLCGWCDFEDICPAVKPRKRPSAKSDASWSQTSSFATS